MSPERSIDAILLAPLCRDEIVEPSGVRTRPGGVGLYASWALARRGCRVRLHTPLADADRDLLDALPDGVEVVAHPSRATTRFRIEVDPGRPNLRRLILVDACDPLDPDAIGRLDTAAYILAGPLLPADFGTELRAVLAGSGRPFDLGVQGLVRGVAADGTVTLSARPMFDLPRLRTLAGDEEEITALEGARDPITAAAKLAARCAEEVVVTRGDRGAWIVRGLAGERIEIAAVPPSGALRQTIGLGDTFLAVYGWERRAGFSPADAGAHAAQAAADLMGEGCRGRER